MADIEVEMNRLRDQDAAEGFNIDRLDYRHIAAAVLDERERCAGVALQETRQEAGDAPEIRAVNLAALRIASRIRKGPSTN